MPRPPKPKPLRQNRERRDYGLVPLEQHPMPAPNAPSGLLTSLRRTWTAFWGSPLAQNVVLPTDIPALERLWRLYDERERASRAARRQRIVVGSQGQPVLHPLLRYVGDLDAEIRQLEDRFGLTPLARLRLGITQGQALEQLNAVLEADDNDADLRLTYAAPAAADPRDGGDPVDGAVPRPRAGRPARRAVSAR